MKITVNPVFDWETLQRVSHDGQYEYTGPAMLLRGEDKRTADAAAQERAKQDAMNAQMEAQRQQQQQALMSKYQNLYDSAASGPEMEAAAASFGSAGDALARRAARTGNTAGEVEGRDLLAREKAQTQSDIIRKNQLAALSGMGNLYGIDTNLLARSLGLPVDYLQVQEKAREPKNTGGFWQSFSQGLGSGLAQGVTGAMFA